MKHTTSVVLAAVLACAGLLAQPQGPPRRPREGRQRYSIEQATSDRAQLNTIAFSGLAFLTGDYGSATFIPPGKVADFFGFQYMRDIDAAEKGHNPMFLDRIAGNVMRILTPEQRQRFQAAAEAQAPVTEAIARRRLPLIAAFWQELQASRPALDRRAVLAHCADLFALDADLAYQRARVFGEVARSLSAEQRQALGRLTFGNFQSWPEVDREDFRQFRPRGASKLVSVGFMTLASEFFSWYAGSVEADTYFCPERHGTYFGGFYLKDLPAMGQRDFDISTALTGDAGEDFLDALTSAQRSLMTQVLEGQRAALREIVEVRRRMSVHLRGFLQGGTPDAKAFEALGRRYGQLDGELAYSYAMAFAAIRRTLDPGQVARLRTLRGTPAREAGSAFLYSDRIPLPSLPDAGAFFGQGRGERP